MALDLTLTKEDEQKISYCDFYSKAKQVVAARERNMDFEVGATVLLGHEADGKIDISGSDKYVIIKNDDGFLFAKRIISGGVLGKTVNCLTIEYSHSVIMPDPTYIDAVLLDDETSYDPSIEGKELARKKSKATRLNKSKRFTFTDDAEAESVMKTWKVGDKFWSSDYLYCDHVKEHEITAIEVKKQAASWMQKETTYVEISCNTSGAKRHYNNGTTTHKAYQFTNKYYNYFKEKPIKAEDVL